MGDENALAALLEFLIAGRPERLTHLAVAEMPPEQRVALRAVNEAFASVGLAEAAVLPSPELRSRILASVRARLARGPRRALLVCDMIRDHLTPGRPLEVPRARAIVPALATRIEKARGAGEPVVYVLDRHPPDDPELDEWTTHAVEGTEGAEVWPELAPTPRDVIVTKPSYSGFYGSSLDSVLDELAVDTLVLTGCATEVQLMATATDALQRGFAVELPADCQAGASGLAERVTIGVLGALVPYAPARAGRLARIAKMAERSVPRSE
jgi:nicotinamidase/pyrazinamidase